ncbi:MAG: D-alanyl-D-alanine carboxypeptidase family protein [Lachnospiraceae bacterium]
MRCINRIRAVVSIITATVLITGCSSTSKAVSFENAYDLFETSSDYGLLTLNDTDIATDMSSFFASEYCVSDGADLGTDQTYSQVAEASGVFNLITDEIKYSQNLNERIYPASTTKILTAYIALKYGDPNTVVTVSETAVDLPGDSSTANLKAGDQLTLDQLLRGLMMRSGNDAANAIAESISGSIEGFAELMNQEANALGATNSHFVNPHGYHDEDHYTTVYDMYLFMQAAASDPRFLDIIQTPTYTCDYMDANGAPVQQVWNTTNYYLVGEQAAPNGVTVLGGKTGTTFSAGYCLVIYSENSKNEPNISIIMKADCRSNLYLYMNQLLEFTN